jgi:acetolactate synthase-1/2/3 large subunit
MPKMTGAQALTRQLRAEGVDTVFALPGVQIMSAFDAFYEHRDSLRLVHTRHEQATTYMADGYAKATGKVGVAMVVPGPGALNAATGLGTAYASSSPVLLISGQIASTSLGRRRGELHEVEEQLDVFKPITKWNHRVTRVEEIPAAVHEAFRQLQTGRPRPVELEIPPDTLAESAEVGIVDAEPRSRPAATPAILEDAARLLSEAKRPAILAGGGTIASGASAEVIAIAERLQAPVITNQQSKGIIPDEHPLHLGVNYIITPVEKLLGDTDVLLCVGTRLHFRDIDESAMPRIIHVDIDEQEIAKNYPTEIGIVADARDALRDLLRRLDSLPPRESRTHEVTDTRKEFRDSIRNLVPEQTRIIDVLRTELDEDAVVVSGVTNIGYWSIIMMPIDRPRSLGRSALRRRRIPLQPAGAIDGGALRHQRRCDRFQQRRLRRVPLGSDAPIRRPLHRHRSPQPGFHEARGSLRGRRDAHRCGGPRRDAPGGAVGRRAGPAGGRRANHDAAISNHRITRHAGPAGGAPLPSLPPLLAGLHGLHRCHPAAHSRQGLARVRAERLAAQARTARGGRGHSPDPRDLVRRRAGGPAR